MKPPIMLTPCIIHTAKILSARLIVVMGSLSRASAFGIVNSNIVQAVLAIVNKLVGGELKALQQKEPATAQSGQDALQLDLQLDTKGSSSARPGARSSRASARRSSQEDSESDQDADGDAMDESDPFESTQRSSRSQNSAVAAARTKLKPQQLLSLTQDLLGGVPLFATQTDDYVLGSCADLLVSILFLSATKAEYSGERRV